MIASEGPCYSDRLVRLLGSQLSSDEERSLTSHLDHCELCREELHRLSGPQDLWQETREVLGEATELSDSPDRSWFDESPSSDDATQWIRHLLEPNDDPHSLGKLDGRPVQAVIGQGGMGVVLKVWDTELHRPLAVKLLSPMLASIGTARQRFFREAQSAAAVVHPNIVPIYAVTCDGPLPYIVMPLVGGGSLQQKIERDGPLPVTELLSIGLQIAEALSAAHRQGLVHRDIKPANILLDDGGHRVMLSDFGLARALDDASMTASGMVAGTPNYMSPEQARGEAVDTRTDLYSLGAVLYTMATGHPPVRGDSPLAVLRRVTEDSPRVIHSVNETMPIWLDRVVGRFLQKDAGRRLATADEAAELLRGCLAHLRAPARNALPVAVVERNRVVKWSWSVALATATFAIGFLFAWYTPTSLLINSQANRNVQSPQHSHVLEQSTAQFSANRQNSVPVETFDVNKDELDANLESLLRALQSLQQHLQLSL